MRMAYVDSWYYLKDGWYRVEDHRVVAKQPAHYSLRAGLALEALDFLPLQEATYLSAGVPRVGGEVLSGADGQSYTIRFPEGHLPPVDAFWSLTVYEGYGWLAKNPIGRHNLDSRDELRRDADAELQDPIAPMPFSSTVARDCMNAWSSPVSRSRSSGSARSSRAFTQSRNIRPKLRGL